MTKSAKQLAIESLKLRLHGEYQTEQKVVKRTQIKIEQSNKIQNLILAFQKDQKDEKKFTSRKKTTNKFNWELNKPQSARENKTMKFPDFEPKYKKTIKKENEKKNEIEKEKKKKEKEKPKEKKQNQNKSETIKHLEKTRSSPTRQKVSSKLTKQEILEKRKTLGGFSRKKRNNKSVDLSKKFKLSPLQQRFKNNIITKNKRTASVDLTAMNRRKYKSLKLDMNTTNNKIKKKLSKEERKKQREKRKEEKKKKKLEEKEMKKNKKEEKKRRQLEKKILKQKNKSKKKKKIKSKDVTKIDLTNQELIQMIMSPDYSLIKYIISILKKLKEYDRIIVLLLNIFNIQQKTMEFLEFSIAHEIELTKKSENLFRSNTFTTKLLTVFTLLYAKKYIVDTLHFPINNIMLDNRNLEIDPNKIQENEDHKKNCEKMKNKTKLFLDTILQSKTDEYIEFKHICYLLRSVVKKSFPEMELMAVGSFIFLRIFCVFISSPTDIGLATKIPEMKTRKVLIQITKLIQALANDTLFGEASYMNVFNDFLTNNKESMKTFLEEISSTDYSSEIAKSDPIFKKKTLFSFAKELKQIFGLNYDIMNEELMKTKSRMSQQQEKQKSQIPKENEKNEKSNQNLEI
ncbi:neurofibromin [Anaeramoeba flamelloides]|uniref:Neurofibromin n=1 Tax=Anaeramoeba flamelloides TaxID=1746091 RepID=A0ABQ8XEV8_9EUKA|nr:neurofibromin [Anaeramoeba flamelloides]